LPLYDACNIHYFTHSKVKNQSFSIREKVWIM